MRLPEKQIEAVDEFMIRVGDLSFTRPDAVYPVDGIERLYEGRGMSQAYFESRIRGIKRKRNRKS